MAIEDIIWAKNRHMFGGMEPDEVKVLAPIIEDAGNGVRKLKIRVGVPEDTTINEQALCVVSGVIVRGSFEQYPKDEFSGFLVGDYSESGEYLTDVVGDSETVVYLSAFTYSDQGVFNKTPLQVSVKMNRTYLFGYDLTTADSNPDTRVSYDTKDSIDNLNYTVAIKNNLGVHWGSINPGTKFMPRPCMLKYDGTVDYFLDPNDYSKKADGTPSDVANIDYEGNAMMQWPKIYTKRWEENGVYHFRCSDAKLDDDYECWCNYGVNNKDIPSDYFYTAIYCSIYDNNKRYRSISGGTTPATTDKMNNGEWNWGTYPEGNWYTEHVYEYMLIQDLLVMMSCSTNLDASFGSTNCTPSSGKSTNYSSIATGNYDKRGLFYSDNNYSKIFGMEAYYAYEGYRYISGIRCNGGLWTILKYPGGDYTYDSFTLDNAPTSGGYIKSMTVNKIGRLPKTIGGSSTEYECSYHTVLGGTYTSYLIGSSKWAFGYIFHNPDHGMSNRRLTYRPSPEI